VLASSYPVALMLRYYLIIRYKAGILLWLAVNRFKIPVFAGMTGGVAGMTVEIAEIILNIFFVPYRGNSNRNVG